MTWPKQYGGHERTFLERYVVLEEMLAAGAPVGAHWVADRQCGPLLLRFGTEEQRQRILPRIARGELSFAIGMSEPDSGSDLASIRTRADEGAGRLHGQRHQGLDEQRAPVRLHDRALPHPGGARTRSTRASRSSSSTSRRQGITIRPISTSPAGTTSTRWHFEDAFVPEDMRRRQGGRRLEAGDDRARLRAQRAGALPLASSRSSSS